MFSKPTNEQTLRVLCVDDDRDTADTLALLLEMAGFTSQAAYDGDTALAVLQEFDPEALILDVNLPGMDGCTLATQVRSWAGPRSVPLVALTAEPPEQVAERIRQAGFHLQLTKPIEPDRLTALLTEPVSHAQGPSGWR